MTGLTDLLWMISVGIPILVVATVVVCETFSLVSRYRQGGR